MRRLEAAGVCLFCPSQLARHPRQQVLFSTRHWTATPNEFPYPGTSLHLLLVPHQHASDLLELSEEARGDFWFTGATIRHVHAHVLVSSGAEAVRMRFGGRGAEQG